MSVCAPCSRGQHHHDRFTGNGGNTAGTDAGCPYDVNCGPCSCKVVLPPRLPNRCGTCGCPGGHDRG